MKNENLRFVVCINNLDYPASLEMNKIYQVVPDVEIEADGEPGSLTKAARIIFINPTGLLTLIYRLRCGNPF